MDAKLKQAINIIQFGNLELGYHLLVEVIDKSPHGKDAETAWLWMTVVLADPRQKQKCLETVLQLNPNNQIARNGLQKLFQQNPGLAVNSRPTRGKTSQVKSPSIPSTRSAVYFCPVCHQPFNQKDELRSHVANHGKLQITDSSNPPAKPTPTVPSSSSAKALSIPLLFGTLIVGIILVLLFVPGVWEFILSIFQVALFVFLFPLTFPLTMIVVGGITSLFVSYMRWMPEFGLWLLTQKWWWFPGGWITGAVVVIFSIQG
ncbi:MAG: hypothetical protein KA314_02730 [Chloroflexi bacterium]|nr:hypothetical protein [Chloroflexota bacterium]MBP8054724.1 hypothetical protein [Chloroflexota bacterium]